MYRGRPATLILFLCAANALAFTATDRGTGGNNTAEASTAIVPASNLTAGSTAILILAADNANGTSPNLPASPTDSTGNVWTKRIDLQSGSLGANAGVELGFYTSYLTHNFTTSDTLTITYTPVTSVTAKAWTLNEVAPATSGNVILFKDAGTQTLAVATTGTPSLASSGPGLFNGVFLIAGGAAQSADTWVADADTTNGSWSTMQHNGFGTGTTGMSVTSQYKSVTAAGGQTYNPTLTSAVVGLAFATFVEVPPNTREVQSNNVAGSASITITFDKPLAASSLAALCMTADNAATGGVASLPSTVTDSKSNTWTLRQNGLYNPGGAVSSACELGTYTSVLSSSLAVGDTITFNFAQNTVAKACAVFEFSDATAYNSGGVGTGAATGTPSVTTGTITSGDYVIGVAGLEGENSWTGDSDTTNGSWSSPVAISAGTGTTGQALCAQYKKTTAGGTQTFNPTCTSGDTMIQWTELTVGTPPVQGSGAFFQMWP